MRFNEKDKKNIIISFTVSMLLFAGLFVFANIFDDDVGDLLTSLSGRSSQVSEFIFGKKDIHETDPEDEDGAVRNINEINIDINSDKLIIFASDANDFKVYTDTDVATGAIEMAEDEKVVRITSSSRLKATVTVEVPKRILSANALKINVGECSGMISVKAFKDCPDDILNVETSSSIHVVYSDFGSMNLKSDLAPVTVMDCTAKVLSCESENNTIHVEGSFEEISLEASLDISTVFSGDFNRLDASSEYGTVSIGLDLTDGFTARLVNCRGQFCSENDVTLTEQSTQGCLIYRSGNGTAKINITDTKGDISLF